MNGNDRNHRVALECGHGAIISQWAFDELYEGSTIYPKCRTCNRRVMAVGVVPPRQFNQLDASGDPMCSSCAPNPHRMEDHVVDGGCSHGSCSCPGLALLSEAAQ